MSPDGSIQILLKTAARRLRTELCAAREKACLTQETWPLTRLVAVEGHAHRARDRLRREERPEAARRTLRPHAGAQVQAAARTGG